MWYTCPRYPTFLWKDAEHSNSIHIPYYSPYHFPKFPPLHWFCFCLFLYEKLFTFIVLLLLTAHAQRFLVSRMRDFFCMGLSISKGCFTMSSVFLKIFETLPRQWKKIGGWNIVKLCPPLVHPKGMMISELNEWIKSYDNVNWRDVKRVDIEKGWNYEEKSGFSMRKACYHVGYMINLYYKDHSLHLLYNIMSYWLL